MQKKIIVILSFVLSHSAFGQKDSTNNKIYLWLSGGTCITYTENFNNLIGYRLAINSSIRQKYFFTFLYQINGSLDGLFSRPTPNIVASITNGSLLFGIGEYKYKSLACIASTGISYGKLYYRGALKDSTQGSGFLSTTTYENEQDNFNYIGLPIDIKILWTSPIVGINLDLYANIHKHTDYGIIISIDIGKIRDMKK